MNGVTIYEFDAVVPEGAGNIGADETVKEVPARVFDWLEGRCLRAADQGAAAWLRLTQRRGRRAVQMTSYVGVSRAPGNFQIEVLPKVGKALELEAAEARRLLINMLRCLNGFRHIQTDNAKLAATRIPLLEVFIGEYLRSVEHIVKRGCEATTRPDRTACSHSGASCSSRST